jgi:hypothetical protein
MSDFLFFVLRFERRSYMLLEHATIASRALNSPYPSVEKSPWGVASL